MAQGAEEFYPVCQMSWFRPTLAVSHLVSTPNHSQEGPHMDNKLYGSLYLADRQSQDMGPDT